MFNPNEQQNQFYQPINMNNMNSNVNMNLAMNNMNQFTGWNFNMNQMPQFVQMVNSNQMYLMMYNQMLANMQNSQLMQMQNPGTMFQGGAMGNNQFANMNVNNMQGNNYAINLFFVTPDGKKITIQTEPNEKMSSVINKYINKSGDLNAGNYYIFNNKKVAQQLSVAELGITDGSEILVANTGNVIGAALV